MRGRRGRDCGGARHSQARGDRTGPDGRAAVYAALDLGTNNCRLLVARPTGADRFRVIDAFSRIVRLGERLSSTGELSQPAMERAIEALQVCAEKLERRAVTTYRGVATEACRQARNGPEFLARVEAETGLAFEVIAPDEEAALALAGCVSLLDPAVPRAILFDIGGGSTEVMWATREGGAYQVVDSRSLPLGVVGLTERFGGDVITPDGYEAMVGEVAEALTDFVAGHRIGAEIADGRVQMVGTSGTVTTLAGIRLNLPRYNRALVDGQYLDFDDIVGASRALAALDWHGRAAHPCIGSERADLVVAGCAILEAICRVCPVGRLRVADRGLREGILLGLMRRPDLSPTPLPSARR